MFSCGMVSCNAPNLYPSSPIQMSKGFNVLKLIGVGTGLGQDMLIKHNQCSATTWF